MPKPRTSTKPITLRPDLWAAISQLAERKGLPDANALLDKMVRRHLQSHLDAIRTRQSDSFKHTFLLMTACFESTRLDPARCKKLEDALNPLGNMWPWTDEQLTLEAAEAAAEEIGKAENRKHSARLRKHGYDPITLQKVAP